MFYKTRFKQAVKVWDMVDTSHPNVAIPMAAAIEMGKRENLDPEIAGLLFIIGRMVRWARSDDEHLRKSAARNMAAIKSEVNDPDGIEQVYQDYMAGQEQLDLEEGKV